LSPNRWDGGKYLKKKGGGVVTRVLSLNQNLWTTANNDSVGMSEIRRFFV
jgi:hypothetical protein